MAESDAKRNAGGVRLRLAWVAAVSAAMAAGQPARKLSVDDAIREAVARNLELMAERASLDIARAREITARLRPNPVVTASAQTLNVFGVPYSGDSPLGPNAFTSHIDFPLERGGKRERRIELARAEYSLAELGFRERLRQLVAEVQAAYVDVQLAKENLRLDQQTLDSLQKLVAINEARLKAGDLAQVELDRSRVAALQFAANVQEGELRLAQAKARLRLALGRRPEEPGEDFDVDEPMRSGPVPLEKEAALAAALEARPDLLAQKQAVVRSRADLRLQLANAKVDYTVGAELTRQWAYGISGNTMGFSFSVPLPVFNRNQGEIARAQREIAQAEARAAAAELAVRTEVETAYRKCLSYSSLVRQVEAEMLSRAQRVLETTRYSYERGEASLVEFLDAQRAFNEAMQTYNSARANYARSLYELESATAASIAGR
jgi:cobalt-zinc-cadmium efflux system outer membrane protein